MKKFKFAFEKLLAHKRTLEDVARREFLEAQGQVDGANRELNQMYQVIDESRARSQALGADGGALAIVALSQIDEFINLQKIRIERQRSVIRELMFVAEQKQQALIDAAKERKTLEKLREKRLEDFKLALEKHEMKEIDDLVVTRFKAPGRIL
jgi:flagellar FliJ protein